MSFTVRTLDDIGPLLDDKDKRTLSIYTLEDIPFTPIFGIIFMNGCALNNNLSVLSGVEEEDGNMKMLKVIADKLGTEVIRDTFDFSTVAEALGLAEDQVVYAEMIRTKYGIPQSKMDVSTELEIIKDSYIMIILCRMILKSPFYSYARNENRYHNIFNPPDIPNTHNPLGKYVRARYIKRKNDVVTLTGMYTGSPEIPLITFATYWACKYLNPSKFDQSIDGFFDGNEADLYTHTLNGNFELVSIFGEKVTKTKYTSLMKDNIRFLANFIGNEALHLEFLTSSYELMSAGHLVGITSVLYCNVMSMARSVCLNALTQYGIDFFDLQYKKVENGIIESQPPPKSPRSSSSSSSSMAGVEKKQRR